MSKNLPLLIETVVWDKDELDDMCMARISDLVTVTASEERSTVKAWNWCLGNVEGTEEWNRGACEVVGDCEIFVMLQRPVKEFVDWFRCEEWEYFGRKSDDWGYEALDRLRGLLKETGALAGQISMIEALNRAS